MTAPRTIAAAVAALAIAAGCSAREPQLRVGMKSFSEQAILAEVLGQISRAGAGASPTTVDCGDTFGCREALEEGRVDVMVEYSGTGSVYSGAAMLDEEFTLERLREIYAPLGLDWLVPLGFDNGYRVVVATDRATNSGLESISDLAAVDGGIRVACPTTYLHRPRDGLAALVERYGLRQSAKPLIVDDPSERVEALLGGRADVAIVYATDAVLQGRELTVLDDSLGFFPPYEAVVLARTESLDRVKGLADALSVLEQRIDAQTMRKLNYQVQIEGWPAATVAGRFVRAENLAAEIPERRGPRTPELVLATGERDQLDALTPRAIHAIREVFPDRPVRVHAFPDPARALARGGAHLSLLGAERFFDPDSGRRRRTAEAAAVVGTRMVHVLRRLDDSESGAVSGAVGAPPAASGAGRVADAILARASTAATRRGGAAKLFDRVADGSLDAAVVLAEPGDAALADELSRGRLALRPVPVSERPPPYVRRARIPADTYAGQPSPIETFSVQVVIAGPVASAPDNLTGGPAAALPVQAPPLTADEAEALSRATGIAEAPDPVLPSVWSTWPHGTSSDDGDDRNRIADTLLNLLALAFVGWVAVISFRRI